MTALPPYDAYLSARKGAPNDGTGKGEIPTSPNAYSRSKQNSDAAGFHYQWGRKDPFIFATSSLFNGFDAGYYVKYPVKIYNNKLELIYQKDNGGDNTGMTPSGGTIYQSIASQSMMETVKKPNIFYGSTLISQVGNNKNLWDYYWTSYSRGTDGKGVWNTASFPNWHNTYLDGYIVLRPKSIYDPCPYGYRTVTNGTFNDFNLNPGWTYGCYTGGLNWNSTWLVPIYTKNIAFYQFAQYCNSQTATAFNGLYRYTLFFSYNSKIWPNTPNGYTGGISVRCIEDAANTFKSLLMRSL